MNDINFEIKMMFEREIIKNQLILLHKKLGEEAFKDVIINNCIASLPVDEYEDKYNEYTNYENITNICQYCKEGILVNDICLQCQGAENIELKQFKKFNIEDSMLLDVPSNKTSIIIDGKQVNIDLNNVNQWIMPNLSPQLMQYKKGVIEIEKKLNELHLDTKQDIINTINSIYWNITVYFDNNESSIFRPKLAKTAFRLLSIYYGFRYNKIKKDMNFINSENPITSIELKKYNSYIKKIFKNKFLEPFFTMDIFDEYPEMYIKDINNELVLNILEYFNKTKKLSYDIYSYAAIVLYLSKDMNKYIYRTYKDIKQELNLYSDDKLRKNYNIVYNHFNQNLEQKELIKYNNFIF